MGQFGLARFSAISAFDQCVAIGSANAAFLVIVLRQTGGGIVIRDPPPAESP
jgi:hypothetical protein